jgi:hypothetical protein
LFIKDRHLEIYDYPEVEENLKELRQCVIIGDLDGFDETVIKYGQLIQELTLEIDKKITIPEIKIG